MALTFEPDHEPTLGQLQREVTERRSAARVHVDLRRFVASDGTSATAIASAFVKALGLRSPDAWTELSPHEALEAAIRVLQCDLAYKVPLMTTEQAEDLARRFLNYFEEGATFVSNGTLAFPEGGAWFPLTDATFDTGVVGVAAGRVGLLWVEDED
jgi:hypothetical protein